VHLSGRGVVGEASRGDEREAQDLLRRRLQARGKKLAEEVGWGGEVKSLEKQPLQCGVEEWRPRQ
jgi:hypothetical protein